MDVIHVRPGSIFGIKTNYNKKDFSITENELKLYSSGEDVITPIEGACLAFGLSPELYQKRIGELDKTERFNIEISAIKKKLTQHNWVKNMTIDETIKYLKNRNLPIYTPWLRLIQKDIPLSLKAIISFIKAMIILISHYLLPNETFKKPLPHKFSYGKLAIEGGGFKFTHPDIKQQNKNNNILEIFLEKCSKHVDSIEKALVYWGELKKFILNNTLLHDKLLKVLKVERPEELELYGKLEKNNLLKSEVDLRSVLHALRAKLTDDENKLSISTWKRIKESYVKEPH